MFLGFSGNAFKIQKVESLSLGESTRLGKYTVTFSDVREAEDKVKHIIRTELEISDENGPVATLYPESHIYFSTPNPISEVSIRKTPIEDLYFALTSISRDRTLAAFKMSINPLTWWLWVGGVFVVFGSILAIWPTKHLKIDEGLSKSSKTINAEELTNG